MSGIRTKWHHGKPDHRRFYRRWIASWVTALVLMGTAVVFQWNGQSKVWGTVFVVAVLISIVAGVAVRYGPRDESPRH